MGLRWYLNRLQKMGPREIANRLWEQGVIRYSKARFSDPDRWPYSRFALGPLRLRTMPSAPVLADFSAYQIYGRSIDLTGKVDWHFSDQEGISWPSRHYADLSYRFGNPWGDVRINWELNRLQFLPVVAAKDPDLAVNLLKSWIRSNPYQHGPGYLASMEVALRWVAIYWAVCLLEDRIDSELFQDVSGLAVASGKFIEGRLSTHSSTGNHLILEAVGLYWVGAALEPYRDGVRWQERARKILWEQVLNQIHADGSSVEQSFWYLGFVLDALFHYLLLEDRSVVPLDVMARIRTAIDFVEDMTTDEGGFPDFGDRDDGFVFRDSSEYAASPFAGLIVVGRGLLDDARQQKTGRLAQERPRFWGMGSEGDADDLDSETERLTTAVVTYPQGGMTRLTRGKLRALFRHAPLGLPPMYGHGHADALSVLLWWGSTPLLIDVGSGQYNGEQRIRNYFRSTIAHNTVELGGRSQAQILGPFLWDASYTTELEGTGCEAEPWAFACHDGYRESLHLIHRRKVALVSPNEIRIHDSYSGGGRAASRTAFHFQPGTTLELDGDRVRGETGGVGFVLRVAQDMDMELHEGSPDPFLGWCSRLYGEWALTPSLVARGEATQNSVQVFSMEVASE